MRLNLSLRNEFLTFIVSGIALLLLLLIPEENRPSLLPPVQLALGLPWVLLIPGYLLQTCFFPHAQDLSGAERLAIAIGLSVAIIPPLFLSLNYLPWGVARGPIIAGLGLLSAVLGVISWHRRRRLPPGERYEVSFAFELAAIWAAQDRAGRRLVVILGAALLGAIIGVLAIILTPVPSEAYTEFYVLGTEGLARDYPREATTGETLELTVGITNQERTPMTYRIEVWAVNPQSGQEAPVGGVGPLTLARDDTAEQLVRWFMPWSGDDQQVQFRLYTESQTQAEPYRQLHLWLNVTE